MLTVTKLVSILTKCFFPYLNPTNYLKGYLHLKMITSQNVSSEAQIKIFFIPGKILFRSQDVQVFVFLTFL